MDWQAVDLERARPSGELPRRRERRICILLSFSASSCVSHVREKLYAVSHERDRQRNGEEWLQKACGLDRAEKISAKVNEAPGRLMGPL